MTSRSSSEASLVTSPRTPKVILVATIILLQCFFWPSQPFHLQFIRNQPSVKSKNSQGNTSGVDYPAAVFLLAQSIHTFIFSSLNCPFPSYIYNGSLKYKSPSKLNKSYMRLLSYLIKCEQTSSYNHKDTHKVMFINYPEPWSVCNLEQCETDQSHLMQANLPLDQVGSFGPHMQMAVLCTSFYCKSLIK